MQRTEFLTWLGSVDGSRVFTTAIVPFGAVSPLASKTAWTLCPEKHRHG